MGIQSRPMKTFVATTASSDCQDAKESRHEKIKKNFLWQTFHFRSNLQDKLPAVWDPDVFNWTVFTVGLLCLNLENDIKPTQNLTKHNMDATKQHNRVNKNHLNLMFFKGL